MEDCPPTNTFGWMVDGSGDQEEGVNIGGRRGGHPRF